MTLVIPKLAYRWYITRRPAKTFFCATTMSHEKDNKSRQKVHMSETLRCSRMKCTNICSIMVRTPKTSERKVQLKKAWQKIKMNSKQSFRLSVGTLLVRISCYCSSFQTRNLNLYGALRYSLQFLLEVRWTLNCISL